MCTIYQNEFLCRKCSYLVNFQLTEAKCGSGKWDCAKHTVKSSVKVHESECVKCEEKKKTKKKKK